jgi:hypothetical protein
MEVLSPTMTTSKRISTSETVPLQDAFNIPCGSGVSDAVGSGSLRHCGAQQSCFA